MTAARRIGGLLLFLLSFGAASAGPDPIPVGAVRVLWDKVEGTLEGTGFALLCPDGKVRVLASAEILGGARPRVSIGLREKKEEIALTGITSESGWGIAILEPAKPLPLQPFSLAAGARLQEGMEVIVQGFPLPGEVSIVKTQVVSADPAMFRLGREVGFEYCGSPVLDGEGKLLGMVRGEVFQGRVVVTHADAIRTLLRGFGRGFVCRQTGAGASRVPVEVEGSLCDPMKTARKVVVAHIRHEVVDAMEAEPKPGPAGWGKAIPAMQEAAMAIAPDHRTARAVLQVDRKAGDPDEIFLYVQVAFQMRDDTAMVWFAPQSVRVRFEGASVAPPSSQRAVSKVQIKIPSRMEVRERASLDAVVGGMALSEDGSRLTLLDLKRGLLRSFDASSLAVVAEAEVLEEPVAMSASRDGGSLFVLSRGRLLKPGRDGEGWGCLQVFDAKDLRPIGDCALPFCPTAFLELQPGQHAVSGYVGAGNNLCVVSMEKRKILDAVSVLCGEGELSLHLHPEGRRFYAVRGSGACCVSASLDRKGRIQVLRESSPSREPLNLSGAMAVTPDGQLLLASKGGVLGLSPADAKDMIPAGKVDAWTAAGVSPYSDAFVTVDAEGRLRAYEKGGTKPVSEASLGFGCARILLDPVRKRLYGVTLPVRTKDSAGTENLGDLVAFSWGAEAKPASTQEAGAGELTKVRLATASGDLVEGLARLPELVVGTSLGEVRVGVQQRVRLMRSGASWMLQLPDGSSVTGTLSLPKLEISTPAGIVSADPAGASEIHLFPGSGGLQGDPLGPWMLEPGHQAPVDGSPRTMALTAEGREVLLLDAERARVSCFDANGLKRRWETGVPEGTVALATDPGGRIVATAASHRVQVMDLGSGDRVALFDVGSSLAWIQPVDAEVLMAGTDKGEVLLLSVQRQIVVGRLPWIQARWATCALQPGRFLLSAGVLRFPDPPEKAFSEGVLWHPRQSELPERALSPDGTCAITRGGLQQHAGRSSQVDGIPCAKGAPHLAVLFSSGSVTARLTEDGRLFWSRIGVSEAFMIQRTGLSAVAAQFDPQGKRMFVLARSEGGVRLVMFRVSS